MSTTTRFIAGDPYPWPWNGDLRPENTTLIVIDMQTDFCGKGGYIDLMGYDINVSRACIAPIQRVLEKMRAGGYSIIHTREGHRPDLPICPRTSAGARAGPRETRASGSVTRGRWAGSWSAASRAGSSSRS